MRQSVLAVFLLLVLGGSAYGQPTSTPTFPAPLQDFKLLTNVDYPNADGTAFISRSQPLTIGGWVFECRSGLVPVMQRVGSTAVNFSAFGITHVPRDFYITVGVREDVKAAFNAECPAVGAHTGFSITLTDLPPPGVWNLQVAWATWDGAGRIITRSVIRTVTVVP